MELLSVVAEMWDCFGFRLLSPFQFLTQLTWQPRVSVRLSEADRGKGPAVVSVNPTLCLAFHLIQKGDSLKRGQEIKPIEKIIWKI